MNIIVFVKATIDRNAPLSPDETFPGDRDDKADVMTNNYDKHAIEAALKIVEEKGEGKVTAVCLGSDMADKVVKEAIAMGCNEAIRIENSEARVTNFFAVAKILAAAVTKIGTFDLVLFGMQSYDYGTATMAPMVSEFLDLPTASWVERISFDGGKVKVEKVIEGGTRTIELQLPAILSIASSGDFEEPRYTSVRRIMQASRTKVPVWEISELEAGSLDSNVNIIKMEAPPPRTEKCVVFKDEDASTLVDQLLAALKEKGLNLGAYK
ncbi:MAG: electron transfer flavoprotein subunit beta/FixA family protein [Candidatus Heimdallarchaeota archaeon]|nr:MAG: electron transfer flavoprotein subunit beta/FixA family protein [Candidatus Heimdallarchaeota archaeon]